MLGSFAVGKTSLVQQFVRSIFSDKYLTSIGVKIDKKELIVQNQKVNLILWDLAGEDKFISVNMSYLRGASGLFFVADGTRPDTIDTALELQKRVDKIIGEVPCILLLNKADLEDKWEIDNEIIGKLVEQGWTILKTSAKTGQNVEKAFVELCKKTIKERADGFTFSGD